LIIDKIVPTHYDMTQTFDKIIFYDENLNYTKRLYKALTEIKNDETITNKKHILFTHDKDILIKMENETLKKIVAIMENEKIYRTGLEIFEGYHVINRIQVNDNLELENNSFEYYFTVNPGIWNLDEFIKINDLFDYSYRQVEFEVQQYARKNINRHYLNSNNKIRINGFTCSSVYTFITISHKGFITRIPNHLNMTEDEQIYSNELNKIMTLYSLTTGELICIC